MGPVVVDVGNTRIKWGLCSSAQVWSIARLPDDPDAWQKQWQDWKLERQQPWIVSGVHPARAKLFRPRLDVQAHLLVAVVQEALARRGKPKHLPNAARKP